jgi:hypothetical protein
MILKASQRGGGKQLGLHLTNTHDNEHVEIHEVRGFVSNDVTGAFKEAYAVSKATKCKQFLFSVSLNPPQNENVDIASFESAIDRIEERNNLSGQPRVIVFHEKEGRRHAHAVWSRIDAETMTARNLPFFKERLQELSKELYREHDWKMPRGFVSKDERDPRNFTLDQWQQAKRMDRTAKDLKQDIQDAWAISDNKASFEAAMQEKGLMLARGDRRGYVAVNMVDKQVLSLSRYSGKKTKELEARLGEADKLPSVDDTSTRIDRDISHKLKTFMKEAQTEKQQRLSPLDDKRIALRDAHRQERQRFDAALKHRQQSEAKNRAARLRTGVLGLWDRVRGEYKKIEARNAEEAKQADLRDRQQRQTLLDSQQNEHRKLQTVIVKVRDDYRTKASEIYRDLQRYGEVRPKTPLVQHKPSKQKTPDATLHKLHQQFNVQAVPSTRAERLEKFRAERTQSNERNRQSPSRDRN